MIESLSKLIAFPSVAEPGNEEAPYGHTVKAALEYVLELCDSLGFRTKNCDNRVGWAEIGDGDELVGILVHLDVVPAGDGWRYPPFECTLDDDRLYGRGTVDDKGPAIACIYAMKDILDSGSKCIRRIRLIFGQTEEVGEWTDMQAYQQTEDMPTFGFTPDAFFPAIYGEKGIAFVKLSMPLESSGIVRITGGNAVNMVADHCKAVIRSSDGKLIELDAAGVSAHGSMPELGHNAITILMDTAYDMHSNGKIDCPLAVFYKEKIGDCLNGEKIGCAISDEQSGKLTFNVGMIESDENVVDIHVDIRYPVAYTADDVLARLEREVTSYGLSVSIEENSLPVYMDKDGPVIGTLLEAYSEVTDDRSEPLVIGGGTYARAMGNIVAFGPLLPGRESVEHMPNEYISVEDLEMIRKIYRLALMKMAT